jgi:hypothetical protein
MDIQDFLLDLFEAIKEFFEQIHPDPNNIEEDIID